MFETCGFAVVPVRPCFAGAGVLQRDEGAVDEDLRHHRREPLPVVHRGLAQGSTEHNNTFQTLEFQSTKTNRTRSSMFCEFGFFMLTL